jgi:hypothetical protein
LSSTLHLTGFIGRVRELAEITALLDDQAEITHRLVRAVEILRQYEKQMENGEKPGLIRSAAVTGLLDRRFCFFPRRLPVRPRAAPARRGSGHGEIAAGLVVDGDLHVDDDRPHRREQGVGRRQH